MDNADHFAARQLLDERPGLRDHMADVRLGRVVSTAPLPPGSP
jgi:hypothetical protein